MSNVADVQSETQNVERGMHWLGRVSLVRIDDYMLEEVSIIRS
jgi:hypothetical protein